MSSTEHTLTIYERCYLLAQPFLPYYRYRVRRDLKKLISTFQYKAQVLDVGARSSNYTTGIRADMFLLDLPRETELQKRLKLGVSKAIITRQMKQRSNVIRYYVGDFFKINLPLESFDVITAVEVIEHISDDKAFVERVFKLLRVGGYFYLTTPNARTIPNLNPSHIRHYTLESLYALLSTFFPKVNVQYGEKISLFWRFGLKLSFQKHMWLIIPCMISNFINHVENQISRSKGSNCARIFAYARKI